MELGTGKTLWQSPVGGTPGVPDSSPAAGWGQFGAGGPLVTAGGLAFLGTPFNRMLRAYDVSCGRNVWAQPLPAGAHATPMAYRLQDREYLVIMAGGDRRAGPGPGRGDYLVAFSRRVRPAAAAAPE